MNGDGRYPKRLYDRVASEFADVLLSTSTELSMIPVMVGKMLAPKKKTNQRNMYTNILSERNGIGRALIQAKKPSKQHKPNALEELYPPIDPNIIPPMITPAMGAVKQVNA